jgi:predicted AAA+ superfamily ATPase
MKFIQRTLSLKKLNDSAFLFGPRQSGKTWLLKNTLKPDIYIDLLNEKERIRYLKNPELLYDEILAIKKKKCLVVIDEIQKTPNLLNTVHRIIENHNVEVVFILTGSSARKLRRNRVNLLGGRAVTFYLLPFSYYEIRENFDLKNFLQFGGIPNIYLSGDINRKKLLLESYVTTYLKEEIFDEALTRNLPAFSRFLDLAGFENGNILNYSNIARETGVSSKTIKEYFEILIDTLIGFYLPPFLRTKRKRIISHPKFYFVDTGLVFALQKMLSIELTEGTPIYGKVFEHFIVLETIKAITYLKEEITFYYFRTTDGAEVDLILEKHGEIIPIEIKASSTPRDLRGLKSFLKDHKVKQALCICTAPRPYTRDGIVFTPWKDFINSLYSGTLF